MSSQPDLCPTVTRVSINRAGRRRSRRSRPSLRFLKAVRGSGDLDITKNPRTMAGAECAFATGVSIRDEPALADKVADRKLTISKIGEGATTGHVRGRSGQLTYVKAPALLPCQSSSEKRDARMQAFIVAAIGAALAGAGLLTLRWSAIIERRKQRLAAELKREERLANARLDLFARTQTPSEEE